MAHIHIARRISQSIRRSLIVSLGAKAANAIVQALTQKETELYTKVTIEAAGLLNGHIVPIDTGLEKPGIGKALVITGLIVKLNYGGIPFNYAKGILTLRATGAPASDNQWSSQNLLNGTTDAFLVGQPQLFNTGNQIRENTGLVIWCDTHATQGNGTVDVYVTYDIVTL